MCMAEAWAMLILKNIVEIYTLFRFPISESALSIPTPTPFYFFAIFLSFILLFLVFLSFFSFILLFILLLLFLSSDN